MTAFDALTDAQRVELDDLLSELMRDRKYDGLECVVLLRGRGVDKVAFGKGDASVAPGMLARAYREVTKFNREANH